MKNLLEDIRVRTSEIEGFKEWWWVESDDGGFGSLKSGPRNDWLSSHQEKYFKHIGNYDTIITAGACGGMYTRFYAKRFKTVYAFEPDPRNFQCMVMNNPYDNVIKINAALSDSHEMVSTGENNSNIGALKIDTREVKGHRPIIPTLRIDDFNFAQVDVIQLDVEGHEARVLNGARRTIEKFKPVIILERMRGSHPVLDENRYVMVEQSKADYIFKVAPR